MSEQASRQPYADAVGALLDQGYQLEDITRPEVVDCALGMWLGQEIERAVKHHAAITGSGHLPDEHCDAWHALQHALTIMLDDRRRFVMDLLAEATP